MQKQWLCIAPKHARRFQFWQQALKKPCAQITYLDVIEGKLNLDPSQEYICRIESPGEDEETYRAFLALVGEEHNREYGELPKFDAWFSGWSLVLDKIKALARQYQITFLNSPEDIKHSFDKYKTTKILNEHAVSTPRFIGTCKTFDELEQHLGNYPNVFVKPRYGSSASGVMAMRKRGDKIACYSTIATEKNRLFNSLKLRKYLKKQEIQDLFELAETEFVIEEWIPKWQFEQLAVDFRVLVINKQAEFIVPRATKHMISNLHLGNKKRKVEELNLPKQTIESMKSISHDTMKLFPNMLYAGLDILFDQQLNPHVIEVNSFGDLLLNITNEQGQTSYEAQVNCYDLLFS